MLLFWSPVFLRASREATLRGYAVRASRLQDARRHILVVAFGFEVLSVERCSRIPAFDPENAKQADCVISAKMTPLGWPSFLYYRTKRDQISSSGPLAAILLSIPS